MTGRTGCPAGRRSTGGSGPGGGAGGPHDTRFRPGVASSSDGGSGSSKRAGATLGAVLLVAGVLGAGGRRGRCDSLGDAGLRGRRGSRWHRLRRLDVPCVAVGGDPVRVVVNGAREIGPNPVASAVRTWSAWPAPSTENCSCVGRETVGGTKRRASSSPSSTVRPRPRSTCQGTASTPGDLPAPRPPRAAWPWATRPARPLRRPRRDGREPLRCPPRLPACKSILSYRWRARRRLVRRGPLGAYRSGRSRLARPPW